jgi:hypothetical protein
MLVILIVLFVFLLLSGVGLYVFFRKKKDNCEGVKCLNKGKCVDGECKCISGFKGKICEIPDRVAPSTVTPGTQVAPSTVTPGTQVAADLCAGKNCGTNGTCVSGTCFCNNGYSGVNCEKPPDPCVNKNCGTNGTCVSGNCVCSAGYTGDKCQTPPDLCAGKNCGTNGTCLDGKCYCINNYSGDNCEKPPDLCLNVNCGNFGNCVSGKCVCKNAYTGEKCDKPPFNQPWQCVNNTNVPVRSYNGDIQCISTGNPNDSKQCHQYGGRTLCESALVKLAKTPGYICTSENYNDKSHWCSLAKDSFSKMTTVNHPWQCVDNTNVPVRFQDGKIQCMSTGTVGQCYQYGDRSICETELSKLLSDGKGVPGGDCDPDVKYGTTDWCYWAKDSFDRLNKELIGQ